MFVDVVFLIFDPFTIPDVTDPPATPFYPLLPLSLFLGEFSVSPFQTFFNSGIKGGRGGWGWGEEDCGRLGDGILQALSENLQIKKSHWFGLVWFVEGGVVGGY